MADNASQERTGGELHVIVQTPEGVVWEGNAESVSSENNAGVFDILPDHANIISLIEGKPIEVSTDTGTRQFTFEKALISVTNNQVSIYADIVNATVNSEDQKVNKPII